MFGGTERSIYLGLTDHRIYQDKHLLPGGKVTQGGVTFRLCIIPRSIALAYESDTGPPSMEEIVARIKEVKTIRKCRDKGRNEAISLARQADVTITGIHVLHGGLSELKNKFTHYREYLLENPRKFMSNAKTSDARHGIDFEEKIITSTDL